MESLATVLESGLFPYGIRILNVRAGLVHTCGRDRFSRFDRGDWIVGLPTIFGCLPLHFP